MIAYDAAGGAMTWQYDSTTGALSHNGEPLGVGYSGHGAGINNVHLENAHNIGPIPRGRYTIGPFFDDPEKGPLVAHLTPQPGTDTFGRTGLMMHGDNAMMNETASEGCVILGHALRVKVAQSGDTDLLVV